MTTIWCAGLGPKEGWLDTTRYKTEHSPPPEEGMSTEPRPRDLKEVVSWKMIVAVAAMLLVILLPAVFVWAPFSELVVVIKNWDSTYPVSGDFYSIRGDIIYTPFTLNPTEERTWSYSLCFGMYDLYVHHAYPNDEYSNGQRLSVSLSFFETERLEVVLTNPD
jgi:hypothetical protein